MSLPLMPAQAGALRVGLLAAAFAVLLAAGAVRAEDADPYSATVSVDATAATVVKAREAARLDGQRRALAAIVQHLAGDNPAAKPPKLDDTAITNLIAGFEVAHERMSAVRYVADYTFHFQPAAVRRVLQTAGIGVAEQPDQPPVLLPVYQGTGRATLWDDPNPWRDAWDQRPDGAARITVPLGDARDIAVIDADKARNGDPAALAAIARRNGSDETLVALAAPQGPADAPTGVEVTLRRYRNGRPAGSRSEKLTASPGETGEALLRRAVAAIGTDLAAGWKSEPEAAAAPADQQGTLTAVLPINSLDDWLGARDKLAGVPAIRKVALVALSRQEATIEIAYSGSIDGLKAGLAGIRFDLVRGDPVWRLALTGPGATP